MNRRLDDWDRRIIAILQHDGRTSNVDVARQLGLAEATVRKRLEKLLACGAVHIGALPEPSAAGLEARMIIAVQADLQNVEALAQRLAELPQVRSVDIVTGSYDVLVEVVLPATGHLLSFLLDKIVTIPGIKRTDTFHVLKSVKKPSEWVVPDGGADEPPSRRSGHVVPGAVVLPST